MGERYWLLILVRVWCHVVCAALFACSVLFARCVILLVDLCARCTKPAASCGLLACSDASFRVVPQLG